MRQMNDLIFLILIIDSSNGVLLHICRFRSSFQSAIKEIAAVDLAAYDYGRMGYCYGATINFFFLNRVNCSSIDRNY